MIELNLSGLGPVSTFQETFVNEAPQLLDADVVLEAPDGNFDGGALTLTGLLPEDTISVRNQGTGASQISLSGSDVRYEGTSIGTLSGGVGADLVIAFTAAATTEAIDALIENLTYANRSDTPTPSRDLVLNVTNAAGDGLGSGIGFSEVTGTENPFDGIDVGRNSTPSFVDLDGDGDLDLVVGERDGRLKVFENVIGSYIELTGADSPFDGIDVGYHSPASDEDLAGFYSTPSFADMDGDGDLDLILGENYGNLNIFYNDGGSYTQQNADPLINGIDAGSYSTPSFADLDGDGDLDLILGERYGELLAFENVGDAYIALGGEANPFAGIDVGYYSTPSFADLDGDGDLDLVVGEFFGTLDVFENDGGVYTELTGAANPFEGITVGQQSAPSFADLDEDGDLDLVVGERDGNLNVFENTSALGLAITVEVIAADDQPKLNDLRSSVTFAENTVNATPKRLDKSVSFSDPEDDLEGGALTIKGLLPEDIVSVRNEGRGVGQIGLNGSDVTFGGISIGTLAGGAGEDLTIVFNAAATSAAVESLIENLTYANSSDTPTDSRDFLFNVTDAAGGNLVTTGPYPFGPSFVAVSSGSNPFKGIDVGNDSVPTFGDLDGDGDLDMVVGAANGKLNVFENEGGTFTELTGADNPFAGINAQDTMPTLVDLDGDGDLDLVVGVTPNTLRFFRNDGDGFTELTGTANPFAGIAYFIDKPKFIDLDGDGDLDLIEEQLTSFEVFYNEAGSFSERTYSGTPLDDIRTGNGIRGSFADLDGDGDLDVVVTAIYWMEDLQAFENQGGTFIELTGNASPVSGFRFDSTREINNISLVDLDDDGDLDMVTGMDNGKLKAFENTGPVALLTVNVTPEDDPSMPPVLTGLPSDVRVLEDTASDVDLSGVSLSDPDTGTPITVQLVASAGTLVAASAAGVTAAGSGTSALTLIGTGAEIDAYLNDGSAIQYTGAPDVFGDGAATLTLSGDDGENLVALGVVTIDITDTLDTQTGDDDPNVLTGDDGADLLNGEGGDDHISGADGNDTVFGGDGDDTLRGDSGKDFIEGGDDDDLIIGGTGADDLFGEAGNDEIRGGGAKDLLNGGDGEDLLIGGGGNDGLRGGNDNDKLKGNDGNDNLRGGNGDDRLDGGADNDTLLGGGGDDNLFGAAGVDILDGEAGEDTFVFKDISESNLVEMDLIRGVDGVGVAGGDVIDLRAIDADSTSPATDQAFNFLGDLTGSGGVGVGTRGLWVEDIAGGDTMLYGKVNNDAVIDFAVRIEDGATDAADYIASDFLL